MEKDDSWKAINMTLEGSLKNRNETGDSIFPECYYYAHCIKVLEWQVDGLL